MASAEISLSASATPGPFELRSSDTITAGPDVDARMEHVPSKWVHGTLELTLGGRKGVRGRVFGLQLAVVASVFCYSVRRGLHVSRLCRDRSSSVVLRVS